MKTKCIFLVTTVVVLGLCSFAWAHGGEHGMLFGTVQAVYEDRIELKTEDHEAVTVKIGSSTQYDAPGNTAGSWSELRTGMRVVVTRNGDGGTAETVRYAPMSARGEAKPQSATEDRKEATHEHHH